MTDVDAASGPPFESYLTSVATRLGERGYEERSDGLEDYRATVFHDRTLSLTKFGLVDYHVVVGRFEALDPDAAAAFSEAAFEYGLANKSLLPRGAGGNLIVFPVMAVEGGLASETLDWVRTYSPKHWASFEVPVVVDPEAGRHAYNPTQPTWGNAYYDGFWEVIEECLAPPASNGNQLATDEQEESNGQDTRDGGPENPASHPTPSRD